MRSPLRLALFVAAALTIAPDAASAQRPEPADLVVRNAQITTFNPARPDATTLVVRGRRVVAVGDESVIRHRVGPATRVIDAGGRRVLPGLNDSHLHVIRGGLNYTLRAALGWSDLPGPGARDAARSSDADAGWRMGARRGRM